MRDERGDTIDYFRREVDAAQQRLDGLWQLARSSEGDERAEHDKELKVANDRLRMLRGELGALETEEGGYAGARLHIQRIHAELGAILGAIEERLSTADTQAPPDAQPHSFSEKLRGG